MNQKKLIQLISAYLFIYKDKFAILQNRFKSTKIRLELKAGFVFGITTFNEQKVKDFL